MRICVVPLFYLILFMQAESINSDGDDDDAPILYTAHLIFARTNKYDEGCGQFINGPHDRIHTICLVTLKYRPWQYTRIFKMRIHIQLLSQNLLWPALMAYSIRGDSHLHTYLYLCAPPRRAAQEKCGMQKAHYLSKP